MSTKIFSPRTEPNVSQPTGQRAPDSANTLVSPSFAQIVDLIGEGEISGLVDDGSDASAKLKSIFLDGTPIRNADGTYNFNGIAWADRVGAAGQTAIPGFSSAESETAVGAQVTTSTAIVRTISDPTVTSAVVTIEVPQLYQIDKDGQNGDPPTGDMLPYQATLEIDVQPSGGTYATVASVAIWGKCTKAYDRQASFALTGSAPWNIRVRRTSADDADPTKTQSATYWKSYTSVVDAAQVYPNSALVALEIPADQFPTVPARSFLVKGLKVQVPTNYDPVTRAYTGTWDGTFKVAWTDNPAWCFYDLLLNSRYGLGQFLDASSVDKWGLYTIAQYCDALVDDGNGGTEPRFRCNLCLQTQEDAYRVVRDFASIFRALPYWASGAVQVTQDAPADSEYLFTPSNVVDGLFTYTSSAKRARHNVAIVSWNDPSNHYTVAKEYVEDSSNPPGANNYFPIEVSALGCTSQGQAQRMGRWLLYSERLETEVVTFKTGLEGALRSPGAIVTVQDPNRAGIRLGGRVVSATTSTVELDADVTIEAGKTYTLNVILPDGSLASSTISNAAGTTRSLTLSTALAQAPQALAEWVIAVSDLSPVYYRVLAATDEGDGTYSLTALRHEPTKYAAVESGITLAPLPTSIIPSTLAPTNLAVSEALYRSSAGIKVRLSASWDQNPAAQRYVVRWRRDTGNWSNEESVAAHYWENPDVTPGLYWVQVQSVVGGTRTNSAQASYTVQGKTAPPADVTGFAAAVGPLDVSLTWNPVADVDWDHYEIRQGGTDWASASLLTKLAATAWKWAPWDTASHTLWIKAVDTTGNYSTNATSITFTAQNAVTTSYIAPNSVTSDRLAATALQTTNYAQDPSGYATAGAKLDSQGTALKVAAGNVQVGQYTLSDAFFRALNALDGNNGLGKAFYRGSIDKTVGTFDNGNPRNGAPNINVVRVDCQSSVPSAPGSSAISALRFSITPQPTAVSDNMEALTWAELEIWGYSTVGGTASRLDFQAVALPFSRGWGVDSAIQTSFTYTAGTSVAGITGQACTYQAHLLMKVHNIYGYSDQRWYHPVASLYSAMTRDTTPPSGGSAVSGGGASGGGGACPEFHEPVMLADGTEIPAGELEPGMWVLTQREDTLEAGRFLVQAAKLTRCENLLRVHLKDGRSLLNSEGHRFYVRGRGWVGNTAIRPGDVLEGAMPGTVDRIESVGPGHVVKLSVDGAQTFEQRGVLSHNAKIVS